MKIRINGREEILETRKSLAELVSDKALVPEHIVVEYNSRIIPKNEWYETLLGENDNIEIISFVGGG